MSDYVLSPEALQDLGDIWEFIAEDNIEAADRVREEIFAAFDGLVNAPRKGHVREDLTDKPVLFWPVRAYLIVYRPETRPLHIVGVLHGARDIPTLLRKR